MVHPSSSSTNDTFETARYPLPIRLINRTGNILGKFGIGTGFSQEKLLSQARSKTGLSDFGGDEFEEPLAVLLNSIEKEASLNSIGHFMARQMITIALANRLQIHETLKQHPSFLTTPIERPLFIIGYPRTGTTLLQNLLALDKQHRTLKMYEALGPVPPTSGAGSDTDPRIGVADKFVKMTRYISAQVSVIHSLDARGPDECLKLIENSFISPHFLLYFHAPRYWEWLIGRQTDLFTSVYAYHRRQLQLLGQGQPCRWVLKAPVHLFFLDALLQIYPDARIVFLHRDPAVAIPSFCSLVAVGRAMACDQIDPKGAGNFALDLYQQSYERAALARAKANDSSQFYDIDYQKLITDPLATVMSIYEYFGYDPAANLEQAIAKWIRNNPQHKHGVHRYSMEKFGLNSDYINRASNITSDFHHCGSSHQPQAS